MRKWRDRESVRERERKREKERERHRAGDLYIICSSRSATVRPGSPSVICNINLLIGLRPWGRNEAPPVTTGGVNVRGLTLPRTWQTERTLSVWTLDPQLPVSDGWLAYH